MKYTLPDAMRRLTRLAQPGSALDKSAILQRLLNATIPVATDHPEPFPFATAHGTGAGSVFENAVRRSGASSRSDDVLPGQYTLWPTFAL